MLNTLGLARLKQGTVQEGRELFDKASKADPRLTEAGLNAAVVYMASGEYNRARLAYRKVARSVPGFLPALVGQAVAERAMGRFNQAEKAYQQILGLDADNTESLFNLGLLYMRHKEKPAWACEAFRKAINSKRITTEQAKRAKGFLEDLRLNHPKKCGKGSKSP